MKKSQQLRAELIQLVKRPEGVRGKDKALVKWPASSVNTALARLAKEGIAYRHEIHRRCVVFFKDEAAAKLWLEREAEKSRKISSFVRLPELLSDHRTTNQLWRDAEPIITPLTKITIVDAPPPRFMTFELPHVMQNRQSGRVFVDSINLQLAINEINR